MFNVSRIHNLTMFLVGKWGHWAERKVALKCGRRISGRMEVKLTIWKCQVTLHLPDQRRWLGPLCLRTLAFPCLKSLWQHPVGKVIWKGHSLSTPQDPPQAQLPLEVRSDHKRSCHWNEVPDVHGVMELQSRGHEAAISHQRPEASFPIKDTKDVMMIQKQDLIGKRTLALVAKYLAWVTTKNGTKYVERPLRGGSMKIINCVACVCLSKHIHDRIGSLISSDYFPATPVLLEGLRGKVPRRSWIVLHRLSNTDFSSLQLTWLPLLLSF